MFYVIKMPCGKYLESDGGNEYVADPEDATATHYFEVAESWSSWNGGDIHEIHFGDETTETTTTTTLVAKETTYD